MILNHRPGLNTILTIVSAAEKLINVEHIIFFLSLRDIIDQYCLIEEHFNPELYKYKFYVKKYFANNDDTVNSYGCRLCNGGES